MKKAKLLDIIVSFILAFLLIFVTSTISYFFLSSKREITTFSLSDNAEVIIADMNKKTKIEKTETKDYYLYSVTDYERDLSYSWKFLKDGQKDIKIEDSLYIEDDLRLSLDAQTKDTEMINEMVDQKKLIISFDYHGQLPVDATVRIRVSDRFRDGERLYLYYYDPEENDIEYIMHNVEVRDGYVEFQIAHCSDYFLTAAIVPDVANNPQSVNYIIIGLIVVVFILIAVTLFQSKK